MYDATAKYSGCKGSASTLNGKTLTGLGRLDTSVTPSQFSALVRSAGHKTSSILSWTR